MLFNICTGYSIYPFLKKTFYFGNQNPDDNTGFLVFARAQSEAFGAVEASG